MIRRILSPSFLFSSFLILAFTICAAAAAPAAGRGRPGMDFDPNGSPLQKEIGKVIKDKEDKERQNNPPCRRALDDNDPNAIEKFCKFPGHHSRKLDATECSDCGDLVNPAGKVIGKKIATETVLRYANPGQKGLARWDNVRMKNRDVGDVRHGGVNQARQAPGLGGAKGTRLRNATMFPDATSNDDRDCVDRVTGEHLGGYDDPNGPADPVNLIPDGDPRSCFDASGALKATLTAEPGGCRHDDGTFLEGDPHDKVEDECYDQKGRLKTSLEEMIDEDGPEVIDDDEDGLIDEDGPGDMDGDGRDNDDDDCMDPQGAILRGADCIDPATGTVYDGWVELVDEDGPDAIDQDGDGRINEDPPSEDFEDSCRNFGVAQGLPPGLGDVAGPDECDTTRAAIVAINKRAVEDPNFGMKVYKADDQGNLDPNVGMVEFGQERRKVTVDETFAIRCRGNEELIGGECVRQAHPGPGMALGLPVSAVSGSTSQSRLAMMGFTFAPPVVQWGIRVREEVCIDLGFWDFCFEIFYARIGYEFDLATGLRLPVEVDVSDIPDPSVLAGSEVTLGTQIRPLDFTVGDYRQFCEDHALDQEWYISSCERFAFPDFVDSFNPFVSDDERDGAEFVAEETIFAGVQVRIVMIPIINWAIDSQFDLAAACTMLQTMAAGTSLVELGTNLAKTGNIVEALKDSLVNCSSFTTPFGMEPDPTNPLLMRLRSFPFTHTFEVGGDCAEALAKGKVIPIKGKNYPICTGLILGVSGASLEVGLGLKASIGSDLISADWDVSEDSVPSPGADTEVKWRHSDNEGYPPEPVGPFHVENYDPSPGKDYGVVTLSDLTYYLNSIQLELSANLGFGGVLSFLPDIASFTIYNFHFSTGSYGIPIGQHAGTEDIEIPIFVENHALSVDASPLSTDPNLRVDDDTLRVTPGDFGDFVVEVTNLGSVPDDADNFGRDLSNRRDQVPPLTFVINPNTDFDCTDALGNHYWGDPYNGVADDCYGAAGQVRSDRVESIDEDDFGPAGALAAVRDEDGDGVADEDPPDVWLTLPDQGPFALQAITNVPPYTRSTQPPTSPPQALTLSVSPFRHPLTAPGRYPVRISADSLGARLLGMPALDASGQSRLGASDVVYVEVVSFFDPQAAVAPILSAAKPGIPQAYTVEAGNGGNLDDTVALQVDFMDFNQAGCTLTTMGSLDDPAQPACPFRAVPTQIPAAAWTTAAGLPSRVGPLIPAETSPAGFSIEPPGDWAGMEDTTYEFIVTATSEADPAQPPAKNTAVARRTVLATQESMTRYIALEIDEMIQEIENANAQGIRTGGLLPVQMRPVRATNERAMNRILAGNHRGACSAHATNVKVMGAFLHQLDNLSGSGKIPPAMAADWKARADAMRADMGVAEASPIPQAGFKAAPEGAKKRRHK